MERVSTKKNLDVKIRRQMMYMQRLCRDFKVLNNEIFILEPSVKPRYNTVSSPEHPYEKQPNL